MYDSRHNRIHSTTTAGIGDSRSTEIATSFVNVFSSTFNVIVGMVSYKPDVDI